MRENNPAHTAYETNDNSGSGRQNTMRQWVTEDWEFELTVTEGKAGHCRLGFEKGDRFVFRYGCPAGMCPKTMQQIYTWCEVIRCGGDFTYRGCPQKYEMDIGCADGCIGFHLRAYPVNRDENGKPLPNGVRPED
jgi:uncharacterized repeat protein (TIGR04076 family)